MREYLDANASEPLRPEARAAALGALDLTGNPSSVHGEGRAARRPLEDARETLARRFGARPADIVFTSGATEANALALHALGAGRRLVIGATEHDSVRTAAADAVMVPVGRDGVVDLTALEATLRDGPALLALMLVNNETGVIQPVEEAARICQIHGALLHVDAVQAAGRMELDIAALGADSVALSSHKLGGPLGAGALILARPAAEIRPLIAGGGQERGWRAGTPALPAITGFAAAAATRAPDLSRFRDELEMRAVEAGALVVGGGARRIGNTTCLALPGIRADAQVMALDLDGFAVSAGAACSSGKVAASHVLTAMGLGDLAGQAIRVSLPWNTKPGVAERFGVAYARMADRLRSALVARAA